ncbi:MAG: nuclear transport factor 2 family protein [Saprospiraceae bacterium]|nr:nuclear transport factor 2 family protein [Saprospiraceae bacterium]
MSTNFLTLLLQVFIFGMVLSSCGNINHSKVEADDGKTAEFDLNAAKEQIQEKTNRFTEAHITKDTAYLNSSFAEDAKIFSPNSKIVTGRRAIAQLNAEWVNYEIFEFVEETTHFYGNKDYLIDEGTYYLRYGDENTIDKGKYINIWKNENGEWKMYSNIWNTSLPIELSENE